MNKLVTFSAERISTDQEAFHSKYQAYKFLALYKPRRRGKDDSMASLAIILVLFIFGNFNHSPDRLVSIVLCIYFMPIPPATEPPKH